MDVAVTSLAVYSGAGRRARVLVSGTGRREAERDVQVRTAAVAAVRRRRVRRKRRVRREGGGTAAEGYYVQVA
jgi:hypothetical protein